MAPPGTTSLTGVRVLTIDGGGIRGLIPALVLAEVERRTGRPTAELFDFMAGTSTGGLLACGLTRPGADGRPRFSAAELADLYVTEGPRIFRRGLLKQIFSVGGLIDERYEDDGLEDAVQRYLGDTWLSEALVPVFITAYDIERRAAVFFRTTRAVNDPADDFRMADAARATAAAPTYFEPARVTNRLGNRTHALVDGGVFATNPGMTAYAELARGEQEITIMASLGTGSSTRAYAYEDVRWWGQLEWARPLIDVVFDGIADTTEFELATLLGPRYVRLQTALTTASPDLDDAREDNLAALRGEAERLIAERSADIDAVCGALVS